MQHGRLSGDATPATACLHVISTGALVPEGQSFTPYFEASFMCSTEQRRATDSVQLLQNVPHIGLACVPQKPTHAAAARRRRADPRPRRQAEEPLKKWLEALTRAPLSCQCMPYALRTSWLCCAWRMALAAPDTLSH